MVHIHIMVYALSKTRSHQNLDCLTKTRTTTSTPYNAPNIQKSTDIFLKNRGYEEKKHGYLTNIHGYEKSMDIFLNIRGFIPISMDI